eukprot:351087-Chlamydomonas_euryale.AAC.2
MEGVFGEQEGSGRRPVSCIASDARRAKCVGILCRAAGQPGSLWAAKPATLAATNTGPGRGLTLWATGCDGAGNRPASCTASDVYRA